MLYDRWRQIAQQYGDALALHDVGQSQRLTFAQLAAAAERLTSAGSGFVHPRGGGADFVLEVLRGWRNRSVVCPLEADQTPGLHDGRMLPAGIVHLKTTSASTGAASLVAMTADQLAADAANIVATMGLRPEWPNLSAISLAHSYGFSNLVTPLLLHGIPLILLGSALPESLRQAGTFADALTLPAVPVLWRSWHEARAIPRNVRLAISAGAPLPLAVELGVHDQMDLKVHNFYGSSECGGIAYDDSQKPRTDASCVGRPMADVQVAVAEDGCIEVRGRNVAETYWPYPRPNLRDGCFRSSDLGEIIDGRIHLRGRAGDIVNVAGRKVSPETIEQALRLHPGVRECLVFGAPAGEAERNEIIVGCVSAHAGVTGEDLKRFLLECLPAWQVPREWWFVQCLQINERGKLSRDQWRQRWLQNKPLRAPGSGQVT